MPTTLRHPPFEIAGTTLAALALFVAGSARVPPLPGDEARFVQAVREMRARGDWVVPTVAGAPRYDKPILIYWLLGASTTLLGDTPAAARLPANLAAALTVGLIAWWARRRWGPGAGLTAGGLLAASAVVQIEARAATADAVLLLPTVAALLALERLARGDAGTRVRLALWAGLGVAVLAKGPVGPAVAAATALAAWALHRRWRGWELWCLVAVLAVGWAWLGPLALLAPAAYAVAGAVRDRTAGRHLAQLGVAWGAPLAAVIVAPWAVAAFVATDGEFFRVAVGHHVVTRSLSALEGHGGVPGWYLLTGTLAAFPWLALVGPALRGRAAELRRDPETRFLVAWLVGPLLLFELASTKLVHYWLPAYPAGALLVTAWLFGPDGRAVGRGAAAAVATWMTLLAGLVLAAAPAAAAAYFGLDDLTGPALVAAAPLLAGVIGCVALVASRPRGGVMALAAGTALSLTVLSAVYVRRLSDAVAERRAARALLAARAPAEPMTVYRSRAADALVALPPAAVACPAVACIARLVGTRGRVVGIAVERDFRQLRRDASGLRIEWITAVTGLDLVHGRWEGWIVFRAKESNS